MIYYTSDTHFGHKNIIKYCQRPFESVEEMDAEMIRRWNEVVTPTDLVFHLGDFSFYSAERTIEIGQQLNGLKALVLGNHDKMTVNVYRRAGFNTVAESFTAQENMTPILLEHQPRPYNLPTGYKHQICGHVHEIWKTQQSRYGTIVNVGVDQWDFRPISKLVVMRELGIEVS